MTRDQILQAAQVLQWMADQASRLPDEQEGAMQVGMNLAISSLYLIEYTRHMAEGAEPYDALVKTARGELNLSSSQRDLLRALIPRDLGDN